LAKANAKSSLEVRPITPTIGAEILGLDLGQVLSAEEVRRIEQALADHLVLFFSRSRPDEGRAHRVRSSLR
jgi:taurine dioxygenase